jgi:hypothetical protein
MTAHGEEDASWGAGQQPSPLKSGRSSTANLEAASIQAAQLIKGLLGGEAAGATGAGRHAEAAALSASDGYPASDSDISRASSMRSSRAPPQTCRMSPGHASAVASVASPAAAPAASSTVHSAGGARRQLSVEDLPRTGHASPSRQHGDVIQQLQVQHQQRLNEMAEASARIARQKEAEIQHLTSTMQQALEKAAARETAALRRAEKAEQEKAAMERDHKSDMLDLRAQLEHLQERLESRSSAERAELGRRLQGAISNVKVAAERDIEQLSLQMDSLQQERVAACVCACVRCSCVLVVMCARVPVCRV